MRAINNAFKRMALPYDLYCEVGSEFQELHIHEKPTILTKDGQFVDPNYYDIGRDLQEVIRVTSGAFLSSGSNRSIFKDRKKEDKNAPNLTETFETEMNTMSKEIASGLTKLPLVKCDFGNDPQERHMTTNVAIPDITHQNYLEFAKDVIKVAMFRHVLKDVFSDPELRKPSGFAGVEKFEEDEEKEVAARPRVAAAQAAVNSIPPLPVAAIAAQAVDEFEEFFSQREKEKAAVQAPLGSIAPSPAAAQVVDDFEAFFSERDGQVAPASVAAGSQRVDWATRTTSSQGQGQPVAKTR